MLGWHIKHALARKEALIAFGLMLALALGAFVAVCIDAWSAGNDASTLLPAYAAFGLHSSIIHPLAVLYTMMTPLACALAYAGSRQEERKRNLDCALFTRYPIRAYIRSQALAAALVGALIAVLPMLINLVCCLIAFPISSPRLAMGGMSSIGTFDFFLSRVYLSALYESHPYVYVVLSLTALAYYGAICALWAFDAVLRIDRNPIVGLALPFLTLMVVSCVQFAVTASTGGTSGASVTAYFIMAEDSPKLQLPIFGVIWLALLIVVLIDLLIQTANAEGL